MSDSLRILTYNVQCRSWAMEVGADMSIPPSETAEKRAETISENLLSSPRDYDVVCLNEVFDEDARAVFAGNLLGRWPFAVLKADFLDVEVAWPGKPVVGINPLALALNLSGASFFAGWATLGNPKLEDSGLMLFSRWPFALQPLTDQLLSLLDPFAVSELTPLGFPTLGFMPYDDSTGADAWAAKGILYARIERDPAHTYHLFASHTQADSSRVSENETVRARQFLDAGDFVVESVGGSIGSEHVFLLGDLNIAGGQTNVPLDATTAEWSQRFASPGVFADDMVDVWGREQCPGGTPPLPDGTPQGPYGPRDTGPTAQVVYPPPSQRLDYLFRSKSSELVAQHVYVNHALAELPPGSEGLGYLSDHRPLGIDLFPRHPDNSPDRPVLVDADPDYHDTNELFDAQVRWYRIDRHGTYNLWLLSDQEVRHEVYLDTDLSRPRQQYREEFDPDRGPKFVIPSAPFLIKVFLGARGGEGSYELRVHRHEGASPHEAIDLVPGQTYPGAFPASQLLDTDTPFAPWDDTDSMWFILDPTRLDVAGPIGLTVTVTPHNHADTGCRVTVGLLDGPPPLIPVEEGSSDGDPVTVKWEAKPEQRFYVTVTRGDTAGAPLTFDVTATTSVTLFLGGTTGLPQLVCVVETSGWGSDDIAFRLEADGVLVRAISNDEVGDMDEEDTRDLGSWLTAPVAYSTALTATVTEEDDIDPDDVGARTVPTLPDGPLTTGPLAPGVAITQVNPDQSVRISTTVDVDDGHYDFRHTLSRWHEQA